MSVCEFVCVSVCVSECLCVSVCVCLHIRNIINSKDSERQTLGSRAKANITLNEELLATICLRVIAFCYVNCVTKPHNKRIDLLQFTKICNIILHISMTKPTFCYHIFRSDCWLRLKVLISKEAFALDLYHLYKCGALFHV